MTKKRIQIVLTLEIDTGDADLVDVQVVGGMTPVADTSPTELSPSVVTMIETVAPPSLATFELDFARRCVDELGLDLRTPTGGRLYVNAFPPRRFGAKRAVAFDAKSGRAEVYCDPKHAKGRRYAEVVNNNGEPFAVKVYLRSKAAVSEAIALTQVGLDERGS